MADINQQATVQIEVNSESAKRKIAELENKLVDLNKKKKEFEQTGNTAGLVKVEKELQKVDRQMNNARTNAEKCEAALKKLSSASPKELRMTLRQLQNDLNHIERGSKAWNEHVQAIKRVKAEINAVDAELKEHQSLLQRANSFVNKWGMSLASMAASFTGLVFTARQAVEAFAEMDAEMANVQKFTGMTADQVEALNEEFKKMDTRTSREELNKLAQEAGRLGLQTQDEVLGFVKAADIINVALDDLGDGATLTLSKLTDIFGDKMKYGVEDSLLKVGSVINELSQNCTASAPYLADFAQRLAGVGKQANMTIPEIMGFAAVLDSQGQAVEMSATAISQLIMKLFQDPAKIAKATGMDLQAFNKVLKEDTNEALLMLLERLNSLGNIDVLAPVFASMGTDGARASQVLASLAGNIDLVKQQQVVANNAFKEGTSVTKEYNVQNNTVQAQLDKAKKGFREMAVDLGQKLSPAMKYVITGTSAFMRILSSTITFISKNKALILTLTAAIVGYTLAIKANTIAQKADIVFDKLVNALLAARRVLLLAASAAYNALTGNMVRARAATELLNKTLKLSPWGLAIAGVAALAGGLITLLERMKDSEAEATRVAEENRRWKESISNIDEASNNYSSGELTRLKTLYEAATKETNAREARRAAAQRMQSLYPHIFKNFSAEAIAAGRAKDAYDKLTLSIIANARARAAAEKIQENEKLILDLEDKVRRNEAWNTNAGKREQDARDRQNRNNDRNSAQHAFMPGGVQTHAEQELSNTIRDNLHQQEIANKNIKEANGQIRELKATNARLAKIPGVTSILAGGGGTPSAPKVSYTHGGGGGGSSHTGGGGGGHTGGGGGSSHSSGGRSGGGYSKEDKEARKQREKEQKEREKEEKKRKAEEEKKKRLAEALEKKDFKDAFERLKAHRAESNAAAKRSYADGEMDYEDYLKALHDSSTEFYDNTDKLFKQHNLEESEQLAKLHEKREDEEKKYLDDLKQLRLDKLENERDTDLIEAEMDFYDESNQLAFKNEEYRDSRLAQINLDYLQKVLDEQTLGTKEYYDAERALDKAIKEEELRQRQVLEEKMQEWLTTYSFTSAKFRMNQELALLEAYYKAGKIKKEQYEEAKHAIEKKYRDMVDEATGTHGDQMGAAREDMDSNIKALDSAYEAGLVGEEDYQSRRYQIIKAYHDQVKELVSSEGNEWATMLVDLQENWKNALENLGSTIPEILDNIGDVAAATFAVMNAGLQSYSNYSNAARDLEVAKVTKSYDEQIKAAGNNEKKTKKLEEKKQAEIAKIKSKYNKRAQTIEIAQAIASTALAAINAYASASKVSWILGPIAAAMATAAGGLQIATIRKQHQAEAEGYYGGGFTARDRNNRREVGVVHANEFVANHEAVANKQLAPVFRLIDQAQRNNTVGSLTSEDVSRALGQGGILGEMTSNQQRSLTEREASMALVAAAMEQQSAAIVELNRRLEQGIESFMVMDGERGFEKYWENYQALKERPRR